MPLANLDPSTRSASSQNAPAVPGNLGGYSVKKSSKLVLPESVSDPAKPMSDQIESLRSVGSRSVAVVAVPGNLELAHTARYHALPTSDQLIAKAGRPKDDITFFGHIIRRKSTGYKALLKGLDQYHSALKSGQHVTPERLEGLLDHLQDLRKGTDRYVDGRFHTHTGEIKDLRYQLDRNIDLLKVMLQQMKGGAAWPPGTSLRQGIKLARQGVPVKDLFTFRYQNLLNSGMRVDELKPYDDLGLSGAEARLLNESQLGLEEARMYHDVNLPVTRETLLDPNLRSANETAFTELGSGSLNTVSLVTYQNGEEGVFKPLPKIDARVVERGWVAHRTGIDSRSPQTALRNLATVAVARKLGFNVVPDTRIAEHGGKLGILMGKAAGKTGLKTDPSLFDDPEVRRELTKLQLLDALVGQGDRHANNYFIHKDPSGRVTVTGIDNDQCFGGKVTDPNGIARGSTEDTKGFRGVSLPMVIDTEMAKVFNELQPGELDDLLGDMLSSDEVNAAKQRLQGIKDHIKYLPDNCKIATGDWSTHPFVTQLTTNGDSYAERDKWLQR
jgi:hypothetical protein